MFGESLPPEKILVGFESASPVCTASKPVGAEATAKVK